MSATEPENTIPKSPQRRVIWNRESGSKAGISTSSASEESIRELIDRHDLDAELISVDGDEIATTAREAVEGGADVVVAAGGDGTIGAVAAALVGTQTALGILPMGSVMNIPRMLGIERDLDVAANVIREGNRRRIDIGMANQSVAFFEAGSVGLSASIFEHVQRAMEGELRSLPVAVRAAFRYRPPRLTMELDGKRLETRALMAIVAIGPFSGVGFTVAPDARLDDGLFDVQVFRHFSKLDLFRHFASIALGRCSYSPHVRTFRAKQVTIDGSRPLRTRADSNDLGTTPVRFDVLNGALWVIAPPGN